MFMFPANPTRFVLRASTACALVCGLVTAAPATATTFCVTDSTELQNALAAAESNGQSDVIEVAEGTYTAPSGGFTYTASAATDDDTNLEISGGWFGLGNPCQGHHNTPFQTVLDGNGTDRVMHLIVGKQSHVSVRLLTFAGGDAGSGAGGGLILIAGGDGFAATLTVERDAFVDNSADGDGGLYVGSGQAASTARIEIINNLFSGNHATEGSGAAGLVLVGGAGLDVVSNTVLGSTVDNSLGTGGIAVTVDDTPVLFVNNNFWDNDEPDVSVFATDTLDFSFMHNNYQQVSPEPTQSEGNISVAPQYQSTPFDYTPVRNSPLVDAGIAPTQSDSWYLAGFDLNGGDRTVGQVDIGAYEEDVIFRDGFDPVQPL